MRVYLLFSLLFASTILGVKCSSVQAQDDDEDGAVVLKKAVGDYIDIQKSIEQMLKQKIADCKPGTDPSRTLCSVKDICSQPEVHTDSPFLYQNDKGEKISNSNYYEQRADISACLREQNENEITTERDALNTKLGNLHLKKIIAANKKLSEQTDKYNQGAKIQKISAEILNASLEAGLKESTTKWEEKGASRNDLTAVITAAEKKTKTTLNPDVKKSLVEIQFLKMNPSYKEEVERFVAEIVPDYSNKDPLYNWNLLTDEKAAGGKKALEANRARLQKKSQDAYDIFKETQKDLLAYFESKKNETNTDKIERIIERIKTVRFNPPRLTKELKESCPGDGAFYSSADHSFTMCPQMLDLPKMALIETMAHEISHSYDSCDFSKIMYHKKIPASVEEAPFELDLKMDPIQGSYMNGLFEDPDPEDIKDRIQDRVLYRDNPFSTTLSCLQDPRSVHAKVINVDEIKKQTQKELNELSRLGQNNPNNGRARQLNFLNDHQDVLDYFQGCDLSKKGASLGRTQLEEAFADKIASEIVASHMKTLPKSEVEKAILEISLTYDICSNEGEGATKLRQFGVKQECPIYFENKDLEDKMLSSLASTKIEFNTHPESSMRIEHNLLAHPVIRGALKCPEDAGVKYCE